MLRFATRLLAICFANRRRVRTGFPIDFDLVGVTAHSGATALHQHRAIAKQQQHNEGGARAKATPLVIGEGLGTLAKQAVDPHRAIAEQQQHKARWKPASPERGLRH